MNTIEINNNLDRARIRKLLVIGLFGAVLTGIGDFLLGYAEEIPGTTIVSSVMADAPNLPDCQMVQSHCGGVIPALIIAAILGSQSALGAGVGTMFLSFGNAFIFGGLLMTLPDQATFERFQEVHT